jgi:S-adenosylmethionine:tRNA ribosyltransferase-isomerase
VRTELFDFDLPQELIAQHPVEPRDQSRLMVIDRRAGTWRHSRFVDLPELLQNGDLLVRNNTRVIPARLIGRRVATGGRWEGLFLHAQVDGSWEILATTRGRPQVGELIEVDGGLKLSLETKREDGHWVVRPDANDDAFSLLERFGHVPLPPYIRKGRAGEGDRRRYQTLFATQPGAVAAPTAGLHFTDELFPRLEARGISWTDITLHVGVGTFRPVEVEDIESHRLHAEWAELRTIAAQRLNEQRSRGGRIVAVGTTSARTLETAAESGAFQPFRGETALYLRPGHTFRGLDALITNFHLPRSSLLILVAAFAGIELTKAAYQDAIRERYRFYSYGDAMLIL